MSSRLALYFLGSPQLFLDNAPVTTMRRKALALLAYLVIEREQLSRELLSALLWPDYDQSRAFTNLRHTLWEIQQSIGEGWLISDHERIGWNGKADFWLDIRQFESFLDQSRVQKNAALRTSLLTESAKLYRNNFLTGFSLKDASGFNEWAFAESENLRRQLAGALINLSEDYCALGQAEKAIPHARRLITLDPLDESANRRLMTIYWQAGQHNAALKQYKACEELLRKELNLDPRPETYALYKQIRKHGSMPVQTVELSEAAPPQHNLPFQLSSFIGREKEQKEITDLITNHRLVTLTGAGGIGKTRLSIQTTSTLLNEFPHGVWQVELASLSNPALVPLVIITTLGLVEHANRPPQMLLADFLRTKKSLLLLDNCEHIVTACAQLVEALLHSCPDLKVLVTSREALGIEGETVYLVPSLTTPKPVHSTLDILLQYEAVQLFVERARSALTGFSPTEKDVPAIAQICHDLDGMPLALELAAARVKLLTVEEIASNLSDRFQLLIGGTRMAPLRHQTLQSMIDWSYDLLSESERVLLRRLSIFAGGWTLEAAVAVCQGDGIEPHEILDLLMQLLNKSLVVTDRKRSHGTRCSMLETIRQYAHEKLSKAGEAETISQQHLDYFLDLAERAEPNLRAFDMVMWLDRLEAEHDNIRTALVWAHLTNVETQLRLASALLGYWHIRGRANEGIGWLEQGLSVELHDRAGQPRTREHELIRGKALNAAAMLMAMYSNLEKVPVYVQESVALFQKWGPTGKQGRAHAFLALGQSLSNSNQARGMFEQSLALFRDIGDKSGIAQCLRFLLQFSLLVENAQKNDFRKTLALVQEHLQLQREIGDRDGIAEALADLGHLAFCQGDDQHAITLFDESLIGFRTVGNRWAISFWLSVYGFDLMYWLGDYKRAAAIYEEAFAFAQEVADQFLIAISGIGSGIVSWLQGKHANATQMTESSLEIFRNINHQPFIASSLHMLGEIALARADEEDAMEWYESEIAYARENQFESILILSLASLGRVAWAKGNHELAEEKFKEGLRMSDAAGLRSAVFQNLCGLGRVAQSRGDLAAARTNYMKALEIQEWQIDAPLEWAWMKTYAAAVADVLSGLATLANAQNKPKRAVILLGAAEALFPAIRFTMSAAEQTVHNETEAGLRAALGEEPFAAAYEQGKKMTCSEAIAYVMEGS